MSSNRAIEQRNRILGLLLMPLAFFVLASLVTYSPNDYPNSSLRSDQVLNAGGQLGAITSSSLFLVCGYSAFIVPLIFIFLGWNRWTNGAPRLLLAALLIGSTMIISGATVASLLTTTSTDLRFDRAGALGLRVGHLATESLGADGALVVSLLLFSITLVIPIFWGINRCLTRKRVPPKSPDDDDYRIQPLSRPSSI
ncbi:uncharacterized protein METZ01_LOCUS173857 [marine metagenome]|uniref:DNA translocase FtsK 4TM region domain-containing protein n=1 Tax=marine metagenome TaxID=408172 RepID=A0A382C6Q7_9ZZZZ